jgi:hypothetical protein
LSRRHRFTVAVVLSALIFVCGTGVILWWWKAPSLVLRQVERLTGHRATLGGLSLTHRLDLVAYDVRIAGAPPFESQTLAHADRVTVRLGGQGGLFTASEIVIDGLEVEYLGTDAGDNLRIPATAAQRLARTQAGSDQPWLPRIVVRAAQLHGSVELPHIPRIAFRVPQAEIERASDGKMSASLHRLVVDADALGSLRALTVAVKTDRGGLLAATGAGVAVEVPGGGPLLENLALRASHSASTTEFELRNGDGGATRAVIGAHWNAQSAELSVDAEDIALRALATLPASHALGFEDAKAALRVSVALDRNSLRADYAMAGKIRGFDVLHPAIDRAPWRNQDIALGLNGQVDLTSNRLTIAGGELKAVGATLSVKGWIDVTRAPRGALVFATPRRAPLSCASIFFDLPEPVRQALSGMDVEGKLGMSLALSFDATAWEDLKLDLQIDPVCTVRKEAQVMANLLPALVNSSLTPSLAVLVATKLPLGRAFADFVPLALMPRHLPSAFLTSEDSKFFHHNGFDLDMIRHALAQDLENRTFGRGASTITQQLAKNLFLTNQRTVARKLEEAVLTWRLHKLLSKDRVLELYLNVIELGPGIRGVGQAARVYFGKDVAALTPLESAHLAALTPNPHVLARRFREGQVDEGWRQRLYDLLGMMKRHGRLTPAELDAARASKLVLRDLSVDGALGGAR